MGAHETGIGVVFSLLLNLKSELLIVLLKLILPLLGHCELPLHILGLILRVMYIELQLGTLLSCFCQVFSEHINNGLQLFNICHLLVEGLDPIILALQLDLLLMVLICLLLQSPNQFPESVHLLIDYLELDAVLGFYL